MSVRLVERGRWTPFPGIVERRQREIGDEAVYRLSRVPIVRTGRMAASWEARYEPADQSVGIWGIYYARFVDARGRWQGFIRQALEGIG